ncbi:BTB/POZ domain-containing protein 2-like [Gigantopelta aegis]|uniref:BTB/POZ domain-containing protein 2-like n=1 Tax=Gigantopelta aegis TaxID=1735272 RepID=UPI001B88A38D|nr:BTB/POZ domain-containing protein 2-like [Gigantopelta aegis]XP_041378647.1 BTB/POZ domain-containing protein 2-like [Gigantopelta aegis]XP_041378649.1 BTB/POZ domain-containing protein 2-like [Gigantopelta aegis]
MATKKSPRQTKSGFVDSWQRGKSVIECLKHSLLQKIHVDVTFSVGQTRKSVKAHKLILSLRSCVFDAMLQGPMANQDNIAIPDVEAEIFEEFLNYLYTDDVMISGDNVIGLLYVSKKYDVSTLEQLCLTYLSSSMTSDNACSVMEQAHLYDEIQLMEKAYSYILSNGDAALKSAGVTSLCHGCLVKIVKADKLKVDEKSVFEAAVVWSESACRKQNTHLSPETRREVLGEVITDVRYPLLEQKYFVKNVVPTELLTDSEEKKILMYWVCPDVHVSPFNANKRTGVIQREQTTTEIHTQPLTIQRLYECGWTWSCQGCYDDAIMFCVNQNASLRGFQLYDAWNDPTPNYDVTAFLTNATTDELIEGSSVTKTLVAVTSEYYNVEFARPIQLIKDEKYNLVVNIKGPDPCCGMSRGSTVQHGSFVCSFFNPHKSKHSQRELSDTDVKQGQIPGLLFLI